MIRQLPEIGCHFCLIKAMGRIVDGDRNRIEKVTAFTDVTAATASTSD
ncbi:MAG: hypothetical protein K2J63_00790 [Muribaculaceae bacterium]|nr:hypothetical protein [Muribaculaceae bacterium]MDE6793825.1 hypothetical protein [Muribaculaceae bacterium]